MGPVIYISSDSKKGIWLATDANVKQAVGSWPQTLDTNFL
jgi:hypothetical protein